MLGSHHDINQNISFLFKFFFLLVIRSYLYWKQLSQDTSKNLVGLLLFHLMKKILWTKQLHFRQILRPSITQSVDGDLLAFVSKVFLTVAIPLSLSILGYMFTISKETKSVLSGITSEFNSWITWSKWLVSLILVSILLGSGAHTASVKCDKSSMVVLHPVVKRRTGLFSLFVLYSVLFFRVTAFSLTIYSAHSLLYLISRHPLSGPFLHFVNMQCCRFVVYF